MLHLRRKRATFLWATACGCLAIALAAALLITTSPSRGSVAARNGNTPVSSPQPGAGVRPGTQFTPITASTLTVPEPVKGSDGRIHLAYELLLTNVTALPVRISQVQVLDASTHRALLDLTGTALSAEFTPVGAPSGDEGTDDPASSSRSTTMPSSATWVVWLDVSLPGQSKVLRLEHRVAGAIIRPGGASPVLFDDVIGPVDTSGYHATVLSPPVKGGIWYMSEGCCSDNTHHRRGLAPVNGQLSVPQRFAIDFFMLDDRMRAWSGAPSTITSYFSYRQPVIAAAPGTVVDSEDGLPNNTALPNPPPIPPIGQTVGNHVTVQIGPGLFVLYAHLDPGSVKVHIGEKVARGQLLGRVPDRIWDDNLGLQPTGTLPFVPAKPAGLHRDELPLDRDVVRFSRP